MLVGVALIVLVKSAVFVLLATVKGLLVVAGLLALYVFLRGPRDGR